MSDNMDDFNQGVALVFDKLYEAFPQKLDIEIKELADGASYSQYKNYGEALLFLGEEDFVRHGQTAINDDGFPL